MLAAWLPRRLLKGARKAGQAQSDIAPGPATPPATAPNPAPMGPPTAKPVTAPTPAPLATFWVIVQPMALAASATRPKNAHIRFTTVVSPARAGQKYGGEMLTRSNRKPRRCTRTWLI